MRDVYDILVNFKKYPYEFYEWEKEDDISHIKKIPSVKTNDKTLFDIMNYQTKIKDEILSDVEYKTEVFKSHRVIKIKYSFIIYNDDIALALLLDDDGVVIKKSRLLFDEEDDVIKRGFDCDLLKIKYEVTSFETNNLKCTRKENKIIDLLLKYVNNIYDNENEDELKYVYFECFDKEEKSTKNAYDNLTSSIINADFNIINKLKNLVKVLKK